MTLRINYLCFHQDSLVDFEKAKERGWKHPESFGRVLATSLVKHYGDWMFQIVSHCHREGAYQEIFLHPIEEETRPMLKGTGGKLSPASAISAISWLALELGDIIIEGSGQPV